jgi:hypothetical protein
MILEYKEEKEYRDYPAVSQSELSQLDYSPVAYRKMKDKQQEDDIPAFIFGSAVDCLLTHPKDFWKEFVQVNVADTPSDTIKSIVDSIFAGLVARGEETSASLSDYESEIIRLAKDLNYGQSWKQETLIKKIAEGGQKYFDTLIISRGKRVISSEDYQMARNCAEALQTNQFTKKYFEKQDHVELHFQLALLFNVEDTDCKALLDLLVIDHASRRLRVVDIKTTGSSVYAFPSSYMKYRYYLQGSFYTEAVQQYMKSNPQLADYELESPLFLVAEKANVNPPFIYEMLWQDVDAGREGGTYRDRKIKGYKELLRDLRWHNETGNWDYPKQTFIDNGVVQIGEIESSNLVTI